MRLRRLLILGALFIGLLITGPRANADTVGVYTYENGTFTVISNTATDTPLSESIVRETYYWRLTATYRAPFS